MADEADGAEVTEKERASQRTRRLSNSIRRKESLELLDWTRPLLVLHNNTDDRVGQRQVVGSALASLLRGRWSTDVLCPCPSWVRCFGRSDNGSK